MASGPITSWEMDGKQWKQCHTIFFGAPKSLQMVTAAMKLKDAYSLEGKLWPIIQKQRHYFANKGPTSQGYGFSSGHVWMWELWSSVLLSFLWRKLSTKEFMLSSCGAGEDSWESLDSKEIKPVNPKGNQSWIFIGRTDAEAPIFWPPDKKSRNSLEKTLMLGGIGGRRRRRWQWMRWLDGSPSRCTWGWVNSGSWWWIGRPGVLQSIGLQRAGHDWATELNRVIC